MLLESELNENIISDMLKKYTFLKEIMTAWIQINSDKNTLLSATEFYGTMKMVLVQNKTVFRKQWYEKGIKHMCDINDNRTIRYS